jgi:hypothetical protein
VIPLGHIAGIPVEETALSFGPVFLAAGGIAVLRLRAVLARIRATVAGRGKKHRPAGGSARV